MQFINNAARLDYALKQEILEEISGGGVPVEIASEDITDATAIGISVLTATDAAAARTAIGAGTSDLEIGTTASTAAAGNHTQAATTVNVAADATNGITAGNLQVVLSALAARIVALETTP